MSVSYKTGDKDVAQRLCLLRELAQSVKDDLQSMIQLVTNLDRKFVARSRG